MSERVQRQVNRVLGWMERTKDRKEYERLATILDRLWPKAYPTHGSLRPRRIDRTSSASVETVQVVSDGTTQP